MEHVHKEVYAADGKWSSGDKITQPTQMKTLTVNGVTDIWPSWFNAEKNSGVTKEVLVFNKYNHLLASSCTADAYKIEVEVTKVTDEFTKKEVYTVPEPYDMENSDTCDVDWSEMEEEGDEDGDEDEVESSEILQRLQEALAQ